MLDVMIFEYEWDYCGMCLEWCVVVDVFYYVLMVLLLLIDIIDGFMVYDEIMVWMVNVYSDVICIEVFVFEMVK